MTSKQDDNRSTYVNTEYGISLKYNRDWKPDASYSHRYSGEDGFFQINAFSGDGMDIDEVANLEIAHKLKPYGSNPSITKLTINNLDARMIIPSNDQDKGFENQAEVIIKYPKPLVIGEDTYYYFILYSDKEHIQEIAETLEFDS